MVDRIGVDLAQEQVVAHHEQIGVRMQAFRQLLPLLGHHAPSIRGDGLLDAIALRGASEEFVEIGNVERPLTAAAQSISIISDETGTRARLDIQRHGGVLALADRPVKWQQRLKAALAGHPEARREEPALPLTLYGKESPWDVQDRYIENVERTATQRAVPAHG